MNKLLGFLMLSGLAAGSTVWAQEEIGGLTERPAEEVTRGVFESPLNVSARVGALGFRDGASMYSSRMIQGITLGWNAPRELMNYSNMTWGIESGLLLSHNGPIGSNFFGRNAPTNINAGSNLFLIPLNITAGYRITDKVLLSGFVGANAIYRSISSTTMLGRASDGKVSSSTEFFPDVGINVGWEAGKNVGIALRGDLIPTPAALMFTTTLGATFPLA